MMRLIFAIIAGGGVLFYTGYQEHELSKSSSTAPVSVSLAELENGTKPAGNHIEIGEHVAIYDALIYYGDSHDRATEPGPSTRVKSMFYPIVSTSHPLARIAEALSQNLADAEIDKIGRAHV